MRWFRTRAQAQKEADRRNGAYSKDNRVYHRHGDKRVLSYWVGTYLQWLNR